MLLHFQFVEIHLEKLVIFLEQTTAPQINATAISNMKEKNAETVIGMTTILLTMELMEMLIQ